MGEGGWLTAAVMAQKQLQLLAYPTWGSGELQPGALIPRRGLTGPRICPWQLSLPLPAGAQFLETWGRGWGVFQASVFPDKQSLFPS